MDFKYAPMFQLGEDKTEYYKIPGSEQYVSTGEFEGHEMLKIAKEGLTVMANTAFLGEDVELKTLLGHLSSAPGGWSAELLLASMEDRPPVADTRLFTRRIRGSRW